MKPSPSEAAVHPSFLALDRAYLGLSSQEVRAHLSACEECRRYVEAPAETAPASGIVALKARIEAEPRFARSWLFAAMPLAAVAAAIALFVTSTAPREVMDEPYVGAKGLRSVWIYVKRGNETELWDGSKPIAPGDRLRLKVDPAGFHHVAVYSLTQPAEPELLFSGPLSSGKNLTLPDAWEVDASSAPERLFVVFSAAPVEPDWPAWRRGRVPRGIAVLPFVLPKAGPFDPARDPRVP